MKEPERPSHLTESSRIPRGSNKVAPPGPGGLRPGRLDHYPGIGETEEVQRIRTFLDDSDPTAAEQIEAAQA